MAQIGNLGKDIVFETSDQRIFTFSRFSQRVSGRWSKHEVILDKPKSEFNGADLRTITFTIALDAHLGVRPRKMLERLEDFVENGEVDMLVIGNRRIGLGMWKMTDLSESWDYLYSKGELVRASVDISLEEYY